MHSTSGLLDSEKFENTFISFWNALHSPTITSEQSLPITVRKNISDYIHNITTLNEKLEEKLISQIKILISTQVVKDEYAAPIINDIANHGTRLKLLIKSQYEDNASYLVNALNEHKNHDMDKQALPNVYRSGKVKKKYKYKPHNSGFNPAEFIGRGFHLIRNGKLNYGIKVIESVIPILEEDNLVPENKEKIEENISYLLQVYLRLARCCLQKEEFEKWIIFCKKGLEVGAKKKDISTTDQNAIEYFQQDPIHFLGAILISNPNNFSAYTNFAKSAINGSVERLGQLLNQIPNTLWLTLSKLNLNFSSIIKNYEDFVKLFKMINEKDKIAFKVIFKTFENLLDQNENSLLHIAAEKNHLDILKWLVSTAKMDFDAKNKMNRTPLDIAKSISDNKVSALWLEGFALCTTLANKLSKVVFETPSAIDEFSRALATTFNSESDSKLSDDSPFIANMTSLQDVINSYHKNYEKIALAYIKNYAKKLADLTTEQRLQYIASQKLALNKLNSPKLGLFDRCSEVKSELNKTSTPSMSLI